MYLTRKPSVSTEADQYEYLVLKCHVIVLFYALILSQYYKERKKERK